MPAATLETDLYQLTMAAGYFHRGLAPTVATCELFVRRLPRARRYLVAAGIERALDHLATLSFAEDEIAFLREIPALRDAMTPGFCEALARLRFSGEAWCVAEGTAVFANEPLLRIRAPVIEAQLVETHLLSVVNHATMVASKAARIVRAAAGRDVFEFGTRRTHPEAAVDAARAAYLVGAAGTSNVEASRRFGIPVMGTAAHMWTMTHESEEQAFANYVATFPSATILLVDTYDTVRGAERAARVAGARLKGVRLDSGDLAALSREVRARLDAAGCTAARIVASGDLDEHAIAHLVGAGAPIDAFGVGTELVTSGDAPSLGGVYKVVELERGGKTRPIAKFSEGKATFPGAHQVFRCRDAAGKLAGDVLALADEAPPEGSAPLLERRIAAGARLGPAVELATSRAHALAELDGLPAALHALEPFAEGERGYAATPSQELLALSELVRRKAGR
jgi:nicotinate phosphoribosyltransferase